jgi:hypothetical protein
MLDSLLIQNLIVAAIVVTATVLLAIRASRYFRAAKVTSGCGSGCGNCPSNEAAKTSSPQLLQLGGSSRR